MATGGAAYNGVWRRAVGRNVGDAWAQSGSVGGESHRGSSAGVSLATRYHLSLIHEEKGKEEEEKGKGSCRRMS
jgi:hypothetical protein